MDPITQGVLGGATAQTLLGKKATPRLAWAAVLGAMAPDLDILIRSTSDPLLALQFHRHFTHSLIFIPFGGLIIGFLLWLLYRRQISFGWVYLATTLGWATHGLLDACTSYGTLLYWPFSMERVAWDNVSVIDPVVTLLLLAGFITTLITKRPRWARVGLLLALLYLGFGLYQRFEGLELQKKLAMERGHIVERGRVRPTFGNVFVWRSVYEYQGKFYVDAFRILPWAKPLSWPGGELQKFNPAELNPAPPADSVLAKDLKRYAWFSEDYLVSMNTDAKGSHVVGDLRFSIFSNGLQPIWGIAFDPEIPGQAPQRLNFRRGAGQAWDQLWAMLLGRWGIKNNTEVKN